RGLFLVPMPRHILEELYLRDKQAFTNSPHWNTEFVGLGPYQVTTWVQGSHLELKRFDAYYLGRPSFDTIVVRFIGDGNAAVAGLLAGSIDVLTDQSGVGVDAA